MTNWRIKLARWLVGDKHIIDPCSLEQTIAGAYACGYEDAKAELRCEPSAWLDYRVSRTETRH
jgi:hypothetical protein